MRGQAVSYREIRLGVALAVALAAGSAIAAAPAPKADNSLCYVCHLNLQTDEITAKHLTEGVGCAKCHGASHEHMQDEMLMTKPDRLYGRKEVDALCADCHDKPHVEKQPQYAAFLQKWRGHDRPNGRVVTDASICTDCHGTHVLHKKSQSTQSKAADWVPLFNGRDLAGWKPSPGGAWKVDRGRLVAVPGPGAAADLWTDAPYGDLLLSVTFRGQGPLRAGICFRGQPSRPGPRVEINQGRTGSVYVPGKGFALLNLREDLLDDEGWNTLTVELRGPHVAVGLNGEEIGAVFVAGPAEGRIGFHVEGPSKDVELVVREIQIQRLAPAKGDAKP
jgi:hypothetical protein